MKKKILFIISFTVLAFIAIQISLFRVIGSQQSFTLFDLMGPIGGMILGPIAGALAVFLAKAVGLITGKLTLEWLTFARFLPMMLAAVYFGSRSKRNAIIPALCIILFIAHPQGRLAWYYSLYWLIPIVACFYKKRLILNSLGATFTAHAVGSIIFLYAFNLPASIWIGLIPVVAMERGIFTLGIWASYTVFNTALEKLSVKLNWKFLDRLINPSYTLANKEFFAKYA